MQSMPVDLDKHHLDIGRSATHPPRDDSSLRVVLTTVSSDAHTWNLVFLQLYLEEQGHEVVNLGPCVPDEIILAECRRVRADMLIVSSVNGHGGSEGARLIKLLRATTDLADLPAVIGGKLGIRGTENIAFTTALLDAGFDAVFEAQSGPDDLSSFIQGHTPRSQPHRLSILDAEFCAAPDGTNTNCVRCIGRESSVYPTLFQAGPAEDERPGVAGFN